MTGKFWWLWGLCRPAFRQRRCWENAGALLSGILLNMGRHTISRCISSAGAAGRDWSASYRLFERGRVDTGELFRIVREEALRALPFGYPGSETRHRGKLGLYELDRLQGRPARGRLRGARQERRQDILVTGGRPDGTRKEELLRGRPPDASGNTVGRLALDRGRRIHRKRPARLRPEIRDGSAVETHGGQGREGRHRQAAALQAR